MPRIRYGACAGLATTVLGLLVASPCLAAWQNTYNFGATLKGDLYTPAKLGTPPAILVAIHMCTGHSSTVHGWFDSFADTNGFYIIAPDAGKQCFDSSASRDGDKAAIVKMVSTVIALGADKNRVFAAGMSSGGCMTNTLLAIYPDVFAGGSAMPGFPAGGWPAGDTTCTKCGSSPPSTDGTYWANIATKAFAWNGTYPCSQQWVGGGDQYNFNGWLPAVAAQFVTLGHLGTGSAGTGAPTGWTRTVYKDTAGNIRLETNLGPSTQTHDLEAGNLNPAINPSLYSRVVTFVGLDKPTGACGMATTGTDGGTGAGTGGAGVVTGTGGTRDSGTDSGGQGTGGRTGTGGAPSGAGGTIVAGIGGSGSGVGGTVVTGIGGSSTTGEGGAPSGEGGNMIPPLLGGNAGCSCAIASGRGTAGTFGAFALIAFGIALARRGRRRR
jgi:MYXO-CTERM domain-containing protein